MCQHHSQLANERWCGDVVGSSGEVSPAARGRGLQLCGEPKVSQRKLRWSSVMCMNRSFVVVGLADRQEGSIHPGSCLNVEKCMSTFIDKSPARSDG